MQIVTGYEAVDHVTAWQDRDLNQGIFGQDTYVLSVGSLLAPTIASNNKVNVADGVLVMQGCQGVIQKGTFDSLTISNGTQNMLRNDLIAAQYTKDVGTGVESMELVVIKGTPAASSPSDPTYTDGDIQNGDALVQAPIYRVRLNGINISAVELMVPIAKTVESLEAKIDSDIASIKSVFTEDTGSVSAANNTDVTLANTGVLLAGGTYLIICSIGWSANSTGRRNAYLADSSTGSTITSYSQVTVCPLSTVYTRTQFSYIYQPVVDTTLYLRAYQNSGSVLDVAGDVKVLKIY